MAKYRKKPVVIEAEQYVEYGKLVKGMCNSRSCYAAGNNEPHVHTIHDNQIVNLEVGDYIIPEPDGEHYYPCKPDIFHMTYEDADKTGQISDGYHTFDELYYHRMILFSIVCDVFDYRAWKSWKHHDGTMYDDYFIVGINTPEGKYSYHYHKDYWDMFNVQELEMAPEWDGHQPKDITRLLSLE